MLRGMGWGSERSGLPRFGIVPAIPPADARRLVAAELGAVVQLKGSAWWGVAEGRALPDDRLGSDRQRRLGSGVLLE